MRPGIPKHERNSVFNVKSFYKLFEIILLTYFHYDFFTNEQK